VGRIKPKEDKNKEKEFQQVRERISTEKKKKGRVKRDGGSINKKWIQWN